MTGRHNRLWLALRIRNLPLLAQEDAPPPAEPAAVAEQRRLIFVNEPARLAGVTRGMDITTAQLLARCRIDNRQPSREEDFLRQLRDRLYRFTPHIDIHRSRRAPPAGLLLEISTCLRLFHGLRPLCDGAFAALEADGCDYRWGLAHTAPGAWLLSFARHPLPDQVEGRALFIARLNALPIDVLYDYPAAVDALAKMGFATLGDLARQIQSTSLASLSRRLGKDVTDTLAGIYGMEHNLHQESLFAPPISTYMPEEPFHQTVQFDHPARGIDHLKPAVAELLRALSGFLQQRQLECQQIQWQLADIQKRRKTVEVRADTPQSDWQLLYDLTVIKLDATPLTFEVDCLELYCDDKLARGNNRLALNFTGERRSSGTDRELSVTLAKLKSRVGEHAVRKITYRDAHLPELSQAVIGLAEQCLQALPEHQRHGLRPAWLLPQPEPVTARNGRLFWRGHLHLVAGPERLAGQWWLDSVARDYYLARRQDNLPVWLYRDLHDKQWYVHGIFS